MSLTGILAGQTIQINVDVACPFTSSANVARITSSSGYLQLAVVGFPKAETGHPMIGKHIKLFTIVS